MKRVLFWQLPVVDVLALPKIVKYYESLGAPLPQRHKEYGMIERWVGYLPAGVVLGAFAGFLTSVPLILLAFAIAGPPELYLMLRGRGVWNYFRGRDARAIRKIFLLERYNAVCYFLLGAAIGAIFF